MSVTMLELPWTGPAGAEGATEVAARRGDRRAWNELVGRHNHQVVLALVASGVLPERARELAQEAWLRLISQADAQRLDHLRLPGLAIRQALYLAQTAARRHEPAPPAEPATPSVEERYFALEQLQRARAKVATLPASSQRVFALVYAQPQLSHAEVAAQVGLSVQRVRQIICEVRKVLRAELGGDSHG